jgi:hypothetical protein
VQQPATILLSSSSALLWRPGGGPPFSGAAAEYVVLPTTRRSNATRCGRLAPSFDGSPPFFSAFAHLLAEAKTGCAESRTSLVSMFCVTWTAGSAARPLTTNYYYYWLLSVAWADTLLYYTLTTHPVVVVYKPRTALPGKHQARSSTATKQSAWYSFPKVSRTIY